MQTQAYTNPADDPSTTLVQAQVRFHELDQREIWLEGEINAGRGTPTLVAELAIVSAYADAAFEQLEKLGGLDPPVDEAG